MSRIQKSSGCLSFVRQEYRTKYLNTHAGREEHKIYDPQVWLLIPRYKILINDPGNYRIKPSIDRAEETHIR